MEENMQMEKELSLLDLMKVLLSKIKILILTVIIGAMIGSLFAVWTTIDVDYYGTTVEFYVNPESEKDEGDADSANSQYAVYGSYGRNVMDAITKLLASESFTEKLMLEESGLPSKDIYKGLDETKYSVAETALNAAQEAWADVKDKKAVKNAAFNDLQIEWEKISNSAFSESAYNDWKNGDYYKENTLLEKNYECYKKTKEDYKVYYEKAEEIQKDTDEKVEEVLIEWRAMEKYEDDLEVYSESVKYSYLGEEEDTEEANNLARSFIYVQINVLNDEEFANNILERVKRVVPEYVEINMIVPTGYTGTSCSRITRTDDIKLTNAGYTRNQVLKYGILMAMAAGVIAAVIIIIADRSDKRLRDYETVMRELKVSVLGVVPTIDEMSLQVENNQKNTEVR